jgi:hypothetical protein
LAWSHSIHRQYESQLYQSDPGFARACLLIFAVGSTYCDDPAVLFPREEGGTFGIDSAGWVFVRSRRLVSLDPLKRAPDLTIFTHSITPSAAWSGIASPQQSFGTFKSQSYSSSSSDIALSQEPAGTSSARGSATPRTSVFTGRALSDRRTRWRTSCSGGGSGGGWRLALVRHADQPRLTANSQSLHAGSRILSLHGSAIDALRRRVSPER